MPKVIDFSTNTTSLHSKLLQALLDRITLSEKGMADHHLRWQNNEKYYMMYKKKTSKDAMAAAKEANGETDYKSVVVPASYANLLTAHTYMVNVFLNRPAIFDVEGIDGSGAEKELAMASLLQYQVRVGEMEVPMFIWLLDFLRYGVGCVGNYWEEEQIPLTRYEMVPEVIDGVETGNQIQQEIHEVYPGYEGNKIFNVLPYDMLPDPRVPMVRLQEGEFFGRKLDLSYNTFIQRKEAGLYFNEDQVKNLFGQTGKENQRASFMDDTSNTWQQTTAPNGQSIGTAKAIEIVVNLVPREWGLGDRPYPEKWVFTILDKKVIIGAQPLGLLHNKFPFHVIEYEADGYKQESRGILEVGSGMNDAMTWLLDSHMYNKRQVMNNTFLADPSRVVMKDMENRRPGMVIRAKPTAYGTDLRTAVVQMQTADVTMQNYGDMQALNQMLQEIQGINSDVAGRSAPSSRRSASEFRGTTQFSANRLANVAKYASITGWRSLGLCLVSSTQQLYDVEMKVKIAGDAIKGAESITVKPEDIAGKFDIISHDGTMPLDRMALAQFWLQVLGMTGSDPELAMQYRRGDIFSYTARLAGLKNIDKFKMQVVQDEEIVAMIKAGLIDGGQNGGAPGGQAQGATGVQTAGDETMGGTPGLPGLAALFAGG